MDRDFETTRTYASAVLEVAEKEAVAGVDLWNAIYEKAGREEKELKRFLTDGLHLNADGYAVSICYVLRMASVLMHVCG